jgi:hypothetical protein
MSRAAGAGAGAGAVDAIRKAAAQSPVRAALLMLEQVLLVL